MPDDSRPVKVVKHPDPERRATVEDVSNPDVIVVTKAGREMRRTRGGSFVVRYNTPRYETGI